MNWLTSSFLASLILWTSKLLFLFVMALVVAIFLCFSTSAHINIYCIIRRHKRQILAQTRAVQDNSRFKRTAFNTFLVHYFLLICYLPLIRNLLLRGENTFRILEREWEWNSMEIVKHGGLHEFCIEFFYLLLVSSRVSHRCEKVSFLQKMTLK